MLRHTLNHLGVAVASKVMPLASLLVYSRFLEPAEFGVVSLFFSYIWILGIVLTLNLHTGIGRFIYDKQHRIGELVGTTLLAVGVLFAVGVVVATLDVSRFAALLNLPAASAPFLFAVAAGQVAESLIVQVLTAREHSGRLLVAIATRSLGSLAATVALLYALPSDKYFAVIYAEGTLSLMLVIYLLMLLRTDRPWSFSLPLLRVFAAYCVPLIPYMLSLTLLSQFDRVMIDRLFGKEVTGIYSIGYNLGILLVMVAGSLLNALNPRFFDGMDKSRYDDVKRDASAVFAVCALCAFTLALFGPEVAALLIPSKYAEGFALIPLVAVGGLASVVFQLWGRVVGYTKKTYLLSLIAVVATVLKIGLNLLLLPVLGYWGAALTTVVAYVFMAYTVVAVINSRTELLRVEVTRETCWLAALAAVVALDHFVGQGGSWAAIAKGAILLVVVGLVWGDARALLRPSAPRLAATQ